MQGLLTWWKWMVYEQWETSQGQGHRVLVDWIAIFAIIQQRDPEVVLRQIGPFVTPDLRRTSWWKPAKATQSISTALFMFWQHCWRLLSSRWTSSYSYSSCWCCTSNLAQSHEVFLCVGLCRWPNWISYVASGLWTRTGNSTFRNLCDSAHFTWNWMDATLGISLGFEECVNRWFSESPDIINVIYLCVELDVRTHGVHDDLLCDGALITNPEREADAASETTRGHHTRRLHHLQNRLPTGSILQLGSPADTIMCMKRATEVCNRLTPCLQMVVHYIPSIPVQRDIIKHDKLVPMTAVRNGFSETNQVVSKMLIH